MSEIKIKTIVPKPTHIILDACCGSRMFWFDRDNPQVIFSDNRKESHQLKDSSSKHGSRTLLIEPDVISDFTALPYLNESFSMVVFDPPHLVKAGKNSWLAKKYGQLRFDWKQEIEDGFRECLRVLRVGGTLIFKWNENDIPVSDILPLCPIRPTIGNRCGKQSKSHWIVFMKEHPWPTPTQRSVRRARAISTFR